LFIQKGKNKYKKEKQTNYVRKKAKVIRPAYHNLTGNCKAGRGSIINSIQGE